MKEIQEIVNRLMYSLGYKTKKSLAQALNISPSDLNNRIRSGTIKQLLIDLAIHHNVNLDWLLTGKNAPSQIAEPAPHQYKSGHYEGNRQDTYLYGHQSEDGAIFCAG